MHDQYGVANAPKCNKCIFIKRALLTIALECHKKDKAIEEVEHEECTAGDYECCYEGSNIALKIDALIQELER